MGLGIWVGGGEFREKTGAVVVVNKCLTAFFGEFDENFSKEKLRLNGA